MSTDRPTEPVGPLEVSDVYKDRCRLSWSAPKDDGGKPITHYVVEMMDVKDGEWTEVTKVQGDTQSGVPGLKPDHKYKFRVMAVNEIGVSEPLVNSKEITAKDPWGRWSVDGP